MGTGRIERIHVAPDSGDPMQERDEAEAVAGRGLRGDRYFTDDGLWNALDEDPERAVKEASDVTFIEREALIAVERDLEIEMPSGANLRGTR